MAEAPRAVLATALVPEEGCDTRLDQYLPQIFPELPTRSGAAKAIKRGRILLDGAPVEGSRFPRPGQRITLLAPAAPPPSFERPIEVIFEDDVMAVILKPPGLPVSGNRHRTVEHALPPNLRPSPRADALPCPRPVHRLDVRTQGLLVVAKTRSALTHLSQQFEARTVFKRYEALAAGRIDAEEGEISRPVEGRDALSRYQRLEEVRSLHSDHLTWVSLWPKTGRTHQLRQHLAALGAPVLGDDLYGKEPVLRGSGLFLAAVELGFAHPETGEALRFHRATPRKFGVYLRREARRWTRYHGEGEGEVLTSDGR